MVDPILTSLDYHHKNCMVDKKENYKFDLGVKGLICHHKIAQRVDLHMLKLKTLPDCQIEP